MQDENHKAAQGGKIQSGAIQGEGDYDAARRFNERERQFVKQHGTPRQPELEPDEEDELKAAERKAKARGTEREHDAADEAIFRDGMSKLPEEKR